MTEQTIIEAVARADVMLCQTVRALAYLGALALAACLVWSAIGRDAM